MKRDDKVIQIEVMGGMVMDVHGLPDGYIYEVIDHDLGEEVCDLCYQGNCPHSCHSR